MGSIECWFDFFKNAGLPMDVAKSYAHSFHENRIQLSMLQDLNKEYLRDLGVYRTGDIILVLKEAKKVQEEGGSASKKRGPVEPKSRSRSPIQVKIPKRMSVVEKVPEVQLLKLTKHSKSPELRHTPPRDISRTVVSQVEITPNLSKNGTGKANSIFNRLGKREEETLVSQAKKLTVSTKPATATMKLVKPVTPKNQRVLLVKKVPAKAVMTDSSDDSDDGATGGYKDTKSVSFSKQDEIMEFSARKKPAPSQAISKKLGARLGDVLTKPMKAKAQLIRTKPMIKTVSLRSDEILNDLQPKIHERLELPPAKKLQKQHNKKFDARDKLPSFRKKEKSSNNGNNKRSLSVFERLGRNQ